MLNKPNLLDEKMEHSPEEKPIRSSDKFTEQEVDLQRPLFSFLKGMKTYF